MLWQIWVPVAIATVVLAAYRLYKRMSYKLNMPVVGSPDDKSLACAVLEGHEKYPNTPFIVPSDPPRVILPMTLYQEVIQAPESDFSFAAELYDTFLGRYTHVGENHKDVIDAVRVDLTRNLGSVLQPIQDEVNNGMSRLVGSSGAWTTQNLYDMILRMVGLMSGRVFVGLPLSRDEEWLKASITFTTDVSKCRMAALRWNSWLRPYIAGFLPEVRHMLAEKRRAHEWMRPLVDELFESQRSPEEKAAKPGSRGTFISWMMKYLPDELKNAEHVGNGQMVLSFAAIHTTSMTTTLALLDLLSRPDYIKPLREELEVVIAQDGLQKDENGNAYLSKSSLAKLKNLDSFVKESQRTSPLNLGGSVRRVQKDYTFSDGLKLPAGTAISFPLWGVYHSPGTQTFSPEYNAETGNAPPAEFDGFRFSRLREVPGREMKHQAATTGPDAFNFGHGPHACPGRFFAVYVIKCIFIELLLNYDIQLKDAVSGPNGLQRPPNFVKQMAVMPNVGAEVEVRKRSRV